MANISEWLKSFEEKSGERILAVVVGKHYGRRYAYEALPDENVILSREDGLAKLDQEYNSGFGGADCYPMYAWSANWVLWIGEYDGATGLSRIPRNPVACEPEFSGDDI